MDAKLLWGYITVVLLRLVWHLCVDSSSLDKRRRQAGKTD